MLQWRNWHTRQIQALFSPGSTPGWSTIFEINSEGDFVNNISAVAIGMLIAAHREGDEEKFRAYVELIAETYEQQGNDHAANIIRSYYTGDYGEQGKAVLDETTEQTTFGRTTSMKVRTISAIPRTTLCRRRWHSSVRHTSPMRATSTSGW